MVSFYEKNNHEIGITTVTIRGILNVIETLKFKISLVDTWSRHLHDAHLQFQNQTLINSKI